MYIEAVNLRPHCSLQQCANSYLSWNFTCHTRGRVRAGPSLQLGTLSTRIALYTRRWRSSFGVLTHADYTLGAVAPRAYARRTHSPAWRPSAACQKTKLIGRPVPEIILSALGKPSADRQTDTRQQTRDRQTRLTANQPTNQPSILPVPSCKLGMRS